MIEAALKWTHTTQQLSFWNDWLISQMFVTVSDVLDSCYPLNMYLTPLCSTGTLQFHSRFRRSIMTPGWAEKKLEFSFLFVSVSLYNINTVRFSLTLGNHLVWGGGEKLCFHLTASIEEVLLCYHIGHNTYIVSVTVCFICSKAWGKNLICCCLYRDLHLHF